MLLFACLLKWHKFWPSTLSSPRRRLCLRPCRRIGNWSDSKRTWLFDSLIKSGTERRRVKALVMPKLFQNYRLLHCAFEKLATCNLQLATYCCYRVLHFFWHSFLPHLADSA